MEYSEIKNDNSLELFISGRLDTQTSVIIEKYFKENLNGVNELILDFKNLEYISSAGLRVILLAQKQMNSQGKMIIRNVSNDILEIFDMTGFSSILTII